MTDENQTKELKALSVWYSNDGEGQEYFEVGKYNVTAIGWGTTSGPYCDLKTVRVFIDGNLSSEFPFANTVGVYYK